MILCIVWCNYITLVMSGICTSDVYLPLSEHEIVALGAHVPYVSI